MCVILSALSTLKNTQFLIIHLKEKHHDLPLTYQPLTDQPPSCFIMRRKAKIMFVVLTVVRIIKTISIKT